MLGKLMKYEWKNIWRAGTLMLLGMFVVTVIGCVVLRMPGGLVTEIADGNNIRKIQIVNFTAAIVTGSSRTVKSTTQIDHHRIRMVCLGNADLPGNPLLPQYVYG